MVRRPQRSSALTDRSLRRLWSCLAAFALIAVCPEAAAAQALAQGSVSPGELLLFSVELDGLTLTDSLTAYGNPEDPLVPLGELARLLDLDLAVLPEEGRAVGRIGESLRPLLVDLASGIVQLGGRNVPLGEGTVVRGPNDMFVTVSALQQLLPLVVIVNQDELVLQLTATEKLPGQARRERLARRESLGIRQVEEETFRVDSPYRHLGRPAFDVSANLGTDNARGGFTRRYEGRVAGDLLKTAFTGFLGTDDNGRPNAARVMLARASDNADLLGPLGATRFSVGDVFTPALSLGPRIIGGAGFTFSTSRQENPSVFDRVTLRGELPIGYDVELYVNDILRSGQDTPAQGLYEFVDVPLVRGLNVVRIVAYGPRGERDEQTRVIAIGGGQLAAGKTSVDAGLVLQERPVIDLTGAGAAQGAGGRGGLRGVVNVAHGLSSAVTVNLGWAGYSDLSGKERQLLTAGLRTTLLGASVQADLAAEPDGARAASVGAAGQLGPVSYSGRHSEYREGFLDENLAGFDPARPITRSSQVNFDFSAPAPGFGQLPVSLRLDRNEFDDGGTTLSARGRTSFTLAQTVAALGVDYTRQNRGGVSGERMNINLTASRLIGYEWQLRATADYDVMPVARMRAVAVTADHNISEHIALRLGMAKSFGTFSDFTAQSGLTARLGFADLTVSADYSTEQRRWRAGLQLGFGLAFDPAGRHYRLTPPGPAYGGSAALQAFIDENGNGQFDAAEEGVAGLDIAGGSRRVQTDARGRAFLTGLGEGPSGRLQVTANAVDTTFLTTPPAAVAFVPRPGQVMNIPYPLTPTAEVRITLQVRRPDGSMAGVSAVRVQLVAADGTIANGASEFDGTVVFESVRPGRYRLELDPDQARRLSMALSAPVALEIAAGKGEINQTAEGIFGRST